MTRAVVVALAVALAASVAQADNHGDPPGPGWSMLPGGVWSYNADLAERQLAIARSAQEVSDALLRYATEGATDCGSEALLAARRSAEAVAVAAGRGGDLDGNAAAAGLLLDVADAAADSGCAGFARPIYRFVVATYTGWGYAAHRQRAEIGLARATGRGRGRLKQ